MFHLGAASRKRGQPAPRPVATPRVAARPALPKPAPAASGRRMVAPVSRHRPAVANAVRNDPDWREF